MKLIYGTSNISSLDLDKTLNENTSAPSYRIKGVFSTIGLQNRNGRTYPRHIWETEVARYNEEVLSVQGHKNRIMRMEHPDYAEVNMFDAPVAIMNKLEIIGDDVVGEATILDNDGGRTLKSLIECGIQEIGVSSRGVGDLDSQGNITEYRLITYDVVDSRSDYGITTGTMNENINNDIVTDKEYDVINDEVVEVCGKEVCSRFKKEEIQIATLELFKNLLNNVGHDKNINKDEH